MPLIQDYTQCEISGKFSKQIREAIVVDARSGECHGKTIVNDSSHTVDISTEDNGSRHGTFLTDSGSA
ncbi:hypothetical protein J6590_007090 [Homalodisca vitripennis]|nr:hypothetical protein J6590_007090 [Homalodisca vitripennis]